VGVESVVKSALAFLVGFWGLFASGALKLRAVSLWQTPVAKVVRESLAGDD
jgi:nucleoside recognition membrane protein YjiH